MTKTPEKILAEVKAQRRRLALERRKLTYEKRNLDTMRFAAPETKVAVKPPTEVETKPVEVKTSVESKTETLYAPGTAPGCRPELAQAFAAKRAAESPDGRGSSYPQWSRDRSLPLWYLANRGWGGRDY